MWGGLWISQKGESTKINFKNIIYIEILNHDVYIHTNNKTDVRFRGSLNALEEKLDPVTFVRIGNSYIVNLSFVSGIQKGECKLENNVLLPISRTFKTSFMEKLNSFLNYDVE